MKKMISALALSLLFASCENIDGKFQALQDLELKDGNRTDIVRAGNYDAVIKLRSKKVKLTLKDDSGSETYNFTLPSNVDLPRTNGSFKLTSAQVRQPYDVAGNLTTDVTFSERRRARESCEYREPYTVCYPDGNGRRVCRTEYRTRFGFRDVEFRNRTQDQRINFNLLARGTSSMRGKFAGREVSTTRVYDYTGPCW